MSADFVAWPKIPRIENEVLTFTEKIDGTNACIVIGDDRILSTQSRTRIIIPGWMRPEGAVVYNKLTQTRYKIIIDK